MITMGFPIEKPPMRAFFGWVGSFSIGNHTVISLFQKKYPEIVDMFDVRVLRVFNIF